jgi:hypothetical protein
MKKKLNIINSWKTAFREGWAIKVSICDNSSVLIVIVSQYTTQCLVRYCTDEEKAVEVIKEIVKYNPREIIDMNY